MSDSAYLFFPAHVELTDAQSLGFRYRSAGSRRGDRRRFKSRTEYYLASESGEETSRLIRCHSPRSARQIHYPDYCQVVDACHAPWDNESAAADLRQTTWTPRPENRRPKTWRVFAMFFIPQHQVTADVVLNSLAFESEVWERL